MAINSGFLAIFPEYMRTKWSVLLSKYIDTLSMSAKLSNIGSGRGGESSTIFMSMCNHEFPKECIVANSKDLVDPTPKLHWTVRALLMKTFHALKRTIVL